MTFARITFAALLTTIALTSVQTARAGYHDIDRQALGLQSLSRELYGEVNLHFKHAAHYYQLRNDSARMFHLAKHIHELAHHNGGLNHIASDLRRLDRLFHSIEDSIEHIEHDAHHGVGHIHGHIGHVKALLAKMEYRLHHLRDDVNDLRWHLHDPHLGHGGHGVHKPHGGHGHVSHGGGFGIAFGNGKFQIKIGH